MNLVFDLDGTLIDSAPDIHAAANRLLAAEGLPPQPFAALRAMIGHGVPHLIDLLMKAAGQPPDAARDARLAARYIAGYEDAVDLTRPYPYVPETLDRLAAAGHRMALCTNKPRAAVQAVLAHLDLAHHFPVIVAGDSPHPRKPDPAPLRAAIADLGGPALYIGDHEVDAATARAAAVPFLLYTEGYRATPAVALGPRAFADWRALPALIDRSL
ncbi:MAG: phosphoglycolate phosphatase [Gemmobacter sp.]